MRGWAVLLPLLLGGCAAPGGTLRLPAPPPAGGGASVSTPAPAAVERRIHDLVNAHRTRSGLPALEYDERVAAAAREHSARMAASGRLSHDGFDARVAAIRAHLPVAGAAENVAFDPRTPAADQLVGGWLGSAGHRRNLEGAYQVTGVGIAQGAGGRVFATQIFVARR